MQNYKATRSKFFINFRFCTYLCLIQLTTNNLYRIPVDLDNQLKQLANQPILLIGLPTTLAISYWPNRPLSYININ